MANNFSLYNLIRYSAISAFIHEKIKGDVKKSAAFYNSFLMRPTKENKLAFDIGANKGNKVAALLKLGFTVIALEPEKNSLRTLRWRYGNNRKVTIVDKGVSDKIGSTSIFINEPRSGLNTMSTKWVEVLKNSNENRWHKTVTYKDSYEVPLTTLDNLIKQYGLPYFVKIDVEGYEDKVIKGLTALPAFISFETNLPEFVDETIACIRHLSSLSAHTVYNYSVSEKLEAEVWLSESGIIDQIKSGTIRYMEIVCKLIQQTGTES